LDDKKSLALLLKKLVYLYGIMKTFFYLILTFFVSTGALWAGLVSDSPFACFVVAFGVWAVFIGYYARSRKRMVRRRQQEYLFEEYMRSNYRRSMGR
jgi:polyferredoxin